MKSFKKINLKSVSDTLVDREMKNITGGMMVHYRVIGNLGKMAK